MRPRGVPRVRRAQSELRVLLAVVQGSRGEGCRRAVQRGGRDNEPGRVSRVKAPPQAVLRTRPRVCQSEHWINSVLFAEQKEEP